METEEFFSTESMWKTNLHPGIFTRTWNGKKQRPWHERVPFAPAFCSVAFHYHLMSFHFGTQISWDLTQIFLKSSYYPRRRYEAHRRRDIKKISPPVLIEILRRSSINIFLRSSWDLKKIFWRFIRILAEEFISSSQKDFEDFSKKIK